MKSKKGFTLIELLAVIVILAIIALIATPIILNMINDARKSAAADSAYGYIEAIDYNNSMNMLNNDKYKKIESGNIIDINNIVKVKGTKPTSGNVTIDKGRVIAANLCIDGFSVIYNGEKVTQVTKSSECGSSTSTEEVYYKNYEVGELIWFNPKDYKYCKEGETNCYSWLILSTDESNHKVDLIYVKEELQWNSDLLTDVNNYTSTWSNKLKVDSKYSEIHEYFNYSNSKARIPILSEINEIVFKKLNDNGSCSSSVNNMPCLVINKDAGYMNGFLYTPSGASTYTFMPFVGVKSGSSTPFYIHPVITVDMEKNPKRYKKYVDGEIVYLDPTDLTKECNADNSVSTSYTNNVCMKWHAFLDEGEYSDKVRLILDHNTSINVEWNSTASYVTEGSKEAKEQFNLDIKEWDEKIKNTARLIEADEIAEITGASSSLQWSSDKVYNDSATVGESVSTYYLDGSGTTYSNTDGWNKKVANEITKSKYAWLFDNTWSCKTYGCNEEYEFVIEGYWTNTPVKKSGASGSMWVVSYKGRMHTDAIYLNKYGIRPVIEVNKSDIQ